MKESNTLEKNMNIKQLKREVWLNTKGQYERFKYHCGNCDYQATTKGSLAEHQRVVHEGVKYPCGKCGQRFSHNGSLIKHQKSVHGSQ